MPKNNIQRVMTSVVLATCITTCSNANAQKCAPLVGDDRRQFAVALAGGGTKAASFSMGVLAALANTEMPQSADPGRGSRNALWQTNLISSVSGGSYAGYFLYSRLIALNGKGAEKTDPVSLAKTVSGYFSDCIPSRLRGQIGERILPSEANRRGISSSELFCPAYLNMAKDNYREAAEEKARWAARPEILHQQFLRCHQDVLLSGVCNFGEPNGDDVRNLSSASALFAVTAISAPFSWLFNLVLDWPLNLSPSRVAYRDGIGVAYGFRPTDQKAIQGTTEWAIRTGSVEGGAWVNNSPVPDPDNLDFEALRRLETAIPSIPRWAINATAAPSRSVLGWTAGGNISMAEHIFHMTAEQQCAEAVGPIPFDRSSLVDAGEKEPIDPQSLAAADANNLGKKEGKKYALSPLLTAVNASAAFLDGNERAVDQPQRFVIASGLQLLNLNWGVDLRNVERDGDKVKRRSSWLREGIHYAVPLLYLGESYAAYETRNPPVFIRLVDGGSSDNLGAYGPIVANVRDVLISDHAQDSNGAMEDLCLLRNELFVRKGLYLHLPGLEDWPKNCLVKKIADRSRDPREGNISEIQAVKARLDALREASVDEPAYFPIWAWPYPYLAGCVSPDEKFTGSCRGGEDRRLWIIKPAFDYAHWLRDQTESNDPPQGTNDSRRLTNCAGDVELPCETSAALLASDLFLNRTSIFNTPEFPQGSTVRMTFNSSATAYGAYRELGNHYARQAIEAIDRVRADHSGELFSRIIHWQGRHPIKKAMSRLDLQFLPAWQDIKLDGWQIETRDCARYGVGAKDRQAYAQGYSDCPAKQSRMQYQSQ